jgi:hypothetical protein
MVVTRAKTLTSGCALVGFPTLEATARKGGSCSVRRACAGVQSSTAMPQAVFDNHRKPLWRSMLQHCQSRDLLVGPFACEQNERLMAPPVGAKSKRASGSRAHRLPARSVPCTRASFCQQAAQQPGLPEQAAAQPATTGKVPDRSERRQYPTSLKIGSVDYRGGFARFDCANSLRHFAASSGLPQAS